jgi:AmmeMemoRadiSam system protein A
MTDWLSAEAGEAAVRLARAEAEAEVLGTRARRKAAMPLLALPRGAFVTVHREQELRGCVGYPEARDPLHDVIPMAARSAVRDPRFDVVRPNELPQLTFEVSVLTPAKPLPRLPRERVLDAIRVGEHGVVVRSGRNHGLLLPQVAVEHGFTAEAFLRACCEKAGLDPEAWDSPRLAWSLFEAQVFAEAAPRGAVLENLGERPDVA